MASRWPSMPQDGLEMALSNININIDIDIHIYIYININIYIEGSEGAGE